MDKDKGKTIRTVGWVVVGVGLFIVGIGVRHSDIEFDTNQKENILDVEFTVIND